MNKSVYSLVLMDDVVAEIDRVAYEMNTSRSNMVNQILAEYVSYVTPEKRMRAVFSRIEHLLVDDSVFQLMLQPSESMFSLRSALSYKYNPSIRYSVELYPDKGPFIGELRVSLRSQNSALTLAMLQFFKLWAGVEAALVGKTEYALEDTRYTRRLKAPADREMQHEPLGEAIAAYIELFDRALKRYFEFLHNPEHALRQVERLYDEHLRRGATIL